MELEDMIVLARRSRECAERAREEEAFWEGLIAERRAADDAPIRQKPVLRLAVA